MSTENHAKRAPRTGAAATPLEPRLSKRDRERTCVGCGAQDAPEALVRLVQASKDSVVVDAAASSFGRGAHLHPRPDCLARACKGGLAKAFKSPIKADVATLAEELVVAFERRIEGLLLAARRSGNAAIGTDAAVEAFVRGAPLMIVACDAGSVAGKHMVKDAIAEGRAVAWGTKERLGALVGNRGRRASRISGNDSQEHIAKPIAGEDDARVLTAREPENEVALLAITGASIAAEILRATTAASGVDACRKFREVR